MQCLPEMRGKEVQLRSWRSAFHFQKPEVLSDRRSDTTLEDAVYNTQRQLINTTAASQLCDRNIKPHRILVVKLPH